jgi:hypothetical protein
MPENFCWKKAIGSNHCSIKKRKRRMADNFQKGFELVINKAKPLFKDASFTEKTRLLGDVITMSELVFYTAENKRISDRNKLSWHLTKLINELNVGPEDMPDSEEDCSDVAEKLEKCREIFADFLFSNNMFCGSSFLEDYGFSVVLSKKCDFSNFDFSEREGYVQWIVVFSCLLEYRIKVMKSSCVSLFFELSTMVFELCEELRKNQKLTEKEKTFDGEWAFLWPKSLKVEGDFLGWLKSFGRKIEKKMVEPEEQLGLNFLFVIEEVFELMGTFYCKSKDEGFKNLDVN